jgi:thymidylate synthase
MIDLQYQQALSSIIRDGDTIQARNSIIRSYNCLTMRFTETPLISVRKTAWKSSIREMEWFLSGSSNIHDLHPTVRKWWEPWARVDGEIPYTYGYQFNKKIEGRNQIQKLVDTLINEPNSRRNVVSVWNSKEMNLTPLPCCHGTIISTYVTDNGQVCLNMVQRSADMILGVPHNLVQYWALLLYIAHQSNMKVGHFNWIGLNCHIYEDHMEVANNIINYKSTVQNTPNLVYNNTQVGFKAEDFSLDGPYKFILNPKLEMTI